MCESHQVFTLRHKVFLYSLNFSQALFDARHATGSFPGSFLFPISLRQSRPADRARLKSPSLSHESSTNRPVPDSHDEREDQCDRRGGVRGFVRRLLHLLRPEETEWPELQEQAAGTWVFDLLLLLTSSIFRFDPIWPNIPNSNKCPASRCWGPPAACCHRVSVNEQTLVLKVARV